MSAVVSVEEFPNDAFALVESPSSEGSAIGLCRTDASAMSASASSALDAVADLSCHAQPDAASADTPLQSPGLSAPAADV